MSDNCLDCKWNRIKSSKDYLRKTGLTIEQIEAECSKCVEAFKAECKRRQPLCLTCAWKDRNLPFESRKRHCKACAEAFADGGERDCATCPWNDVTFDEKGNRVRKVRTMPSDAILLHCKECMGKVKGGTAMNCSTCEWILSPESVRTKHCLCCSMKFSSNYLIRSSINELSNKGQTIISYDNHNSDMVDDRDTVAEIDKDYARQLKSGSGENTRHPAGEIADRMELTPQQFAERAYERMKMFLCELAELTDMQALLFLSEVRGCKKSDFARNHGMSDSKVNGLFKQILCRSPMFRDYIVLTRGSIVGTRGRKPKDASRILENVPKTSKKVIYAGTFQQSLGL